MTDSDKNKVDIFLAVNERIQEEDEIKGVRLILKAIDSLFDQVIMKVDKLDKGLFTVAVFCACLAYHLHYTLSEDYHTPLIIVPKDKEQKILNEIRHVISSILLHVVKGQIGLSNHIS